MTACTPDMTYEARTPIAVFLGPSLDLATARSVLPANYYPPVRMGDIYRLLATDVCLIVIIDGIFHASVPVWQREILAAAAVRTAEDQLKVVLNVLGIVGTWQVRIRPTDQPPFAPLMAISLEEQVPLALKKRPDFVRSQLEVATREIARDFARNQRLPRLDIVSRFSVQAFGEGFDESTGRLRNAEGYAWTIGLRFEQPLGNRFAGNELLKRKLELQQTLMDQQQLLLTIVQEVAQAIRDIETFQEEVQVTRAGTALAHDQLAAEEEKFRLGLTTSFNVLEFQEDLSIARTDETRALSDYNIALARLDQLTGQLQYNDTASTTK